MRRRSDPALSPQKLLEQALTTPVDWPGKVVRLERDSLTDYLQRPLSPNTSVAELYHENSKLYPEKLQELAASRVNMEEFRREFVRRRAGAVPASGNLALQIAPVWRDLVTAAARSVPPEIFYALELRVAADGWLAMYEPVTGSLQIVKELGNRGQDRLHQALRLTAPPDVAPHTGPWLLVLGSFARQEVLLGVRGYRRTLLEAGYIAHALELEAARAGLTIWPIYEFADRLVDEVMDVDGIEESTLVAYELKGSRRVG